MLTALRLGNFKAFAETQRMPIRPLTLIFGANSAGKSSLIHGLLLARHAMETGELDVHRMAIGGDSVDLGGFRQYVHRRDVERRVEWAAEIDVAGLKGRVAELLAPVHRASIALNVGVELDNQGEPLRDTKPTVMSYEVEADGKSLLRMSLRPGGNLQLDRLEHEHQIFRKVFKAIVQTATTTESLTAADFEGLNEAIADIVPEIATRVEKFIPTDLLKTEKLFGAGEQSMLFPVSRGRRKEDLAAAVRFFLPRTLDALMQDLGNTVRAELSCLRYLGPLRSYPPRHVAFVPHHDPNWDAGGGYAWDIIKRDASVRERINEWLSDKDRLQTPYVFKVKSLFTADETEKYLSAFLQTIAREEPIVDGDRDSGPTVTGLARYIMEDPDELAQMIGDSLKDIAGLPDPVLWDMKTETEVSHRDVGIGISQVLPVLVSAFGLDRKILAIEQPEIHLHPKLQAELGDVFIESALGERKNTFIIETHSEHLILRLMRRMRDTYQENLPDGLPPVRPEDVAILFVQPKDSSAVVRLLELDEEGQLLDPWPGGFFEEGFRERFS
ncbi:MAG: hypothetical protein A3F84_16955 [Candidatus Handelsmanbacteria bacterium RIFCSPLOWO2_12_FULL_64_10]|uniref:AAA domain-containing protein n=1 Tax=Handelsmanbacteria sp. (strain RIFCSPLOWO2_12_FULL_64_10) TaxID=1817868 RepID=A0A1F6CD83_HANXR|nr:MAG: hypothetical protein A3F84_16955 [Candidatus Handelsmanbacteria bacterium RIFCSPLOWO2_12_FULL_64_10]